MMYEKGLEKHVKSQPVCLQKNKICDKFLYLAYAVLTIKIVFVPNKGHTVVKGFRG